MTAGCYSRLTADEIARVRDVCQRFDAVRQERRTMLAKLRISRDHARRISQGLAGKKPRREHAYDGNQVLEDSACIHCGYKPWASNTFRPCQ